MDLIDRQALLKQIDIDSDGEPGYYGDTWKFIDTIKSMPSATDTNVGTKLGTDLAQLGTDCISRQSAIDAFNTNLNELVVGGEENAKTVENYLNRVLDKIKCLPSAQPKRIRGKWIEYEQEFMLEEPFKTVQKTVRECSVCTAKIAGMVGIMNFCPNCGADMRGKKK